MEWATGACILQKNIYLLKYHCYCYLKDWDYFYCRRSDVAQAVLTYHHIDYFKG